MEIWPRYFKRTKGVAARSNGSQPPGESDAQPQPKKGRLPRWLAREVGPRRARPSGQPPRARPSGQPAGGRVTVSLDSGAIRVVVLAGRRVVAWGTASADSWLDGDGHGSPTSTAPAERLRNLLAEIGARGGRTVTDLPLHTPLMRCLRLPPVRRRYLAEVVASEVLESVPFSEAEVDLAWQARANGAGPEVFAVAVPKDAVDGHVRFLREAGLRPRAAYAKAVALAHAAGLPDAMILYVGSSHAALVLVREWMPRAVHEVELAGESTKPEEQAQLVARAIQDLAGYTHTLDETESRQELPLVLAGALSPDSPLAKALEEVLGHELLAVAPPLVYPSHFTPSEYAINLGLAMADAARGRARGRISPRRVPTFSLLAERHLPRPFPIRPVAAFIALLLLAVVALQAGKPADSLSQEASLLSGRLAQLKERQRQERLVLASARTLENEVLVLEGSAGALDSQKMDLREELGLLLARLKALTRDALPAGVALSTLKQSGESFDLTGHATSYNDALRYMSNLRASGLFGEASIRQATLAAPAGSGEGASQATLSFTAKVSASAPSAAKDGAADAQKASSTGKESGTRPRG